MPIRYPALPPVAMRFLCIPAPPATLTWSVRYSMRVYMSVVDKPLAENLRDAERLVELAARKKLTLMVGFNRRSHHSTVS
ncbi:putative oxidoreductase [Escherichia coli]|uniref:Putative oxidoreductase n=1 Tax=Escherichia coli TaxID=562 RepID=A0A376P4R5_ECOLX|nr:putative oxidoreductase [Escherichia coli]